MDSIEIQKIFQTIQKKLRCPRCGKRYPFENIHILNAVRDLCFLRLECENHLPILASVALNGQKIEIETVGEKITADDVINTYETISKINSIEELLK